MSAAQRPATLCEAFQRSASVDPGAVALRTAGGGPSLTWAQYAAQVRAVAAGLSGLGVGRGDTVSLMMTNRVEFYPLEVGAQHVGATSFSVYNTLPPADLAHVFGNAGTKVVMCEAQFVDRIRASGAPIEHIVVIDGTSDGAADGVMTVDDLLAAAPADFDFEATWRAVQPDDIVTLIYTSGTTGKPKGVEMSHTNILFESFAVHDVLGLQFGDRATSYLPTAHIADRLMSVYFQEVFGTQVTAVADVRAIAAALPEVRPTVWGAVPRVWEKLKAAVEFAVEGEADEMKRAALQWALAVGAKKAGALLAHQPVPDDVAVEWATADELVLSKLRERLGLDQVRWAVSGAAPIPTQTLGFFVGIGIPVTELWGMSELSCVATVSHPDDAKLGAVGKPLSGLECTIADDGEILMRGPIVMKGYRKEPAKTAETVDADGWLHTGDVGHLDDEGFLTIVDRKKELIINAAGKNMSPASIEKSIKAACPLIGVVMAIGDARPYNTALIVLDAESAGPYAAQHGIADASPETLAADPELIAQIAAGVAQGNTELSRVEQIKRFSVLPAFWEPGGDEITLTMKLKRRPITDKYAPQIDALYAPELGPGVHEPKATVAAAN